MNYTVQPNDTLSSIAKNLTGSALNYLELAELNNLKDPNLIYPGLVLTIPTKFDHPLKFNEIPTKNKLIIIDNYSPNFNYIIEEDKIYYSKKNKDHWVDISDNETARKNLYNFIKKNYDFKGYLDNEKSIAEAINKGIFDYKYYRDSVNSLLFLKLEPKSSNFVTPQLDLSQKKLV